MGEFSIWHWLVALLVLAFVFAPFVLYIVSMQRALNAIDPSYREQAPGTAWLLLIPLFNAIWIFFLVGALRRGYVRMSEAGRMTAPSGAGFGIGIALAVCWVLCLIPYLNILILIPALILFILHWVKIVDARHLVKVSGSGQGSEPSRRGIKGGQIALIVVAAVVGPIVVIGILAAIAIPQYQAYVERAKAADQKRAPGSGNAAGIDRDGTNVGESSASVPLSTGEMELLAQAVKPAFLFDAPPARRFDKLEERVAYLAWVGEMSERLGNKVGDYPARVEFLKTLDYEAKRAGLDRQLLLALINELSDFHQYASLPSGSRGLMLIRPYWTRLIGDGDRAKLFSMRINLRYGTVILRHYLDKRNGDLFIALNDFANDAYVRPPDTQTAEFPDRVLAHWKNRWSYTPTTLSKTNEEPRTTTSNPHVEEARTEMPPPSSKARRPVESTSLTAATKAQPSSPADSSAEHIVARPRIDYSFSGEASWCVVSGQAADCRYRDWHSCKAGGSDCRTRSAVLAEQEQGRIPEDK